MAVNPLHYYRLLDMFVQTKQLNVTKHKSAFQSAVGATFSILVYVFVLSYLVMRLIVLVEHGDTSLQVLKIPDFISNDEILELKVGNQDGFDFRLAVKVFELSPDPGVLTENLENIGSLSVYT